MKAKDLAQLLEVIVRKVVREELQPMLKEIKKSQKPIIKEIKSKKVEVDPLEIDMGKILAIEENKKASKPKTFVKDSVLNDMLNEVAESGEWRTLNENPYTSNQAQGFMQGTVPTQDIDGNPIDTSKPEVVNVMGAMTKDYSQLMKAIDKKKGR